MTTSILEQTRQYHEDIETAEKIASKLLSERVKHKPKYRPIYDHAIQETLLKIQEASRRVLDLYADKDHLRADEITVLGGTKRFSEADEPVAPPVASLQEDETQQDDGRTVWQNFYDQLKVVKDYHRLQSVALDGQGLDSLQDAPKDVALLAAEAVERCDVTKLFSAEESLGQRVDMESIFLEYTNLSKLRKHRESVFRAAEAARLRKKLTSKRANTSAEYTESKLNNDTHHEQSGQQESTAKSSIDAEVGEELRQCIFQEIDYITYLKCFDEYVWEMLTTYVFI